MCSNDREDFFVIGFTSRPVLQVWCKDGQGQYTLTFVDAISKFGAGLTRGDLQVAYGRARESFNGQLQQNFAVLHESGGGKSGVVVALCVGCGGSLLELWWLFGGDVVDHCLRCGG